MKKIIAIYIIFYLFICCIQSYATCISGASIHYSYTSQDSILVELEAYRDCSGSHFPNGIGIEFRSASCNIYFADTLMLKSGTGTEINFPFQGSPTRCTDSSSQIPGIEKYVYSDIVSLPMHCADWIISWTYCCRSCEPTTIIQSQPCTSGSNPGFYLSASFDNLNLISNSSPAFSNAPLAFMFIGQSFTYSPLATEPDGDSLLFRFVTPQVNSTDSIPFIAGYSSGYPVLSSIPVSLNSSSGDINFHPLQQETGVTAIRIEEYRNGNLIGYVTRDMELFVRLPLNTTEPIENKYKVYPNPASSGKIMFTSEFACDLHIIFMNIYGEIILQKLLDTDNFHREIPIDLGITQKGIYLMKIISEHGTMSKKLIIE